MITITQIGAPASVTRPLRVGGTNKAKKVMETAEKRHEMEAHFMLTAQKSNRAENQRDERRAKRK